MEIEELQEDTVDNGVEIPFDRESVSPDNAAATLAFFTNISEKMNMPQEEEVTEDMESGTPEELVEEEIELDTESPEEITEEPEESVDDVKKELKKEIKDEIKKGMGEIRDLIKSTLDEQE